MGEKKGREETDRWGERERERVKRESARARERDLSSWFDWSSFFFFSHDMHNADDMHLKGKTKRVGGLLLSAWNNEAFQKHRHAHPNSLLSSKMLFTSTQHHQKTVQLTHSALAASLFWDC